MKSGQSDQYPEIFIQSANKIQINQNIKPATKVDEDGKTVPAGYDYEYAEFNVDSFIAMLIKLLNSNADDPKKLITLTFEQFIKKVTDEDQAEIDKKEQAAKDQELARKVVEAEAAKKKQIEDILEGE